VRGGQGYKGVGIAVCMLCVCVACRVVSIARVALHVGEENTLKRDSFLTLYKRDGQKRNSPGGTREGFFFFYFLSSSINLTTRALGKGRESGTRGRVHQTWGIKKWGKRTHPILHLVRVSPSCKKSVSFFPKKQND
jgi:hypothetical protein